MSNWNETHLNKLKEKSELQRIESIERLEIGNGLKIKELMKIYEIDGTKVRAYSKTRAYYFYGLKEYAEKNNEYSNGILNEIL